MLLQGNFLSNTSINKTSEKEIPVIIQAGIEDKLFFTKYTSI